MKNRVLATLLTICILFGAFTCVAGAATSVEPEAKVDVGDIVSNIRICPGKTIEQVIDAPEIKGYPSSYGWEFKTADGVWIPYDGEPIPEKPETFILRYYAVDFDGKYDYSKESTVTVEHNPIGPYQYDGLNHWRACDDCDGQAEKGGHSHLGADGKAANKVCNVCGHVRTPQYTGILAFMEWLFALLPKILEMF